MIETAADEPLAQVRGVDVLLTLDDVAAIFRQSPSTIRGYLQKGLFSPLPVLKYPYRWRKADVEHALKTRAHDTRHANHGFAAKKGRPAKAVLRSKRRAVRRR
jgi:hypothetical protein